MKHKNLFDKKMLIPALIDSFLKLNPKSQAKNPVMFVVYIGSILTTFLVIYSLCGYDAGGTTGFILSITLWLWFTLSIKVRSEGRFLWTYSSTF